jgi:IclR family transcriptional regulator, acetate operon repressor
VKEVKKEICQEEKSVGDGGTEAIIRSADVLMLFLGTASVLGVSEIARQLDLSKATVYRILRSLVVRDFLTFDHKLRKYRLGPAFVALGARAFRDLDVRLIAHPYLIGLQKVTGETTAVSILVGASRVYLDQIPSSQPLKMTIEVGQLNPLYAGASSKAILAFAPPTLRQTILSGRFEKIAPQTKVDPDMLAADLQQVMETGVAISFEEHQPGVAAVAAPLIGIDGYALGSICILGPLHRYQVETVAQQKPLVKQAAREISLQLGWNGTFSSMPYNINT